MPNDEKIIEGIAKNQLMSYIEKNEILSKYQSAFRENHFCETTLIHALNDWDIAVENGNVVIVVFLDLKRAFETVDRSKLLIKLRKYGIMDKEYKWFESYLKNRKQKTKYKNFLSNEKDVEIGVPQGTQLSVILFILYINDIVFVPKYSTINMFADDTTITVKAKDINTLIKWNEIPWNNHIRKFEN